jgi:hypothetical protein
MDELESTCAVGTPGWRLDGGGWKLDSLICTALLCCTWSGTMRVSQMRKCPSAAIDEYETVHV